MSGSVVTIGGGFNGQNGILNVPSTGLPPTVNQMLQDYLTGVSLAVTTGGAGFINDDVATNDLMTATGGAGLEVISDTDVNGNVSPSAGPYNIIASANATQLVVEAPGNGTITGSSNTTFVMLGASSNVDYIVQNASSGSIFAAGGSDTITLQQGNSVNDSIYSSGQDSINLFAGGNDLVSVMGSANDTVNMQDANATITATGNSTVGVTWETRNSGGTLDFINNSSAAATVFSSVFANGQAAFNSVTVFGGAGGGYYNGGGAGENSLVGGTGVVTLVGAGNGDFLEAQSNQGQNDFFGGAGLEQMVATSATGANLFALGLNYPGLGSPTVSGTVVTSGSGEQNFDLGNSNGETITGSTAATHNIFNVVGDSTTGGSNFTIVNFGAETSSGAYSIIYLMNDSMNGAGNASITGIQTDQFNANNTDIGLSDGTKITLVGVAATSLHTAVDSSTGATFIWQH
jgi:hypothetical protein